MKTEKTTEEIRNIVKGLTSEECYKLVSEIVRYRKVVLYGNWYSKKNIEDIIEAAAPGYIRDRKLTELLGGNSWNFDLLYHQLGDHVEVCMDGPDYDFNANIITDFLFGDDAR